ncbi:uncharacterized protein LOC117820336 [Notolabrus celidotus]|uniref:uncharacterized protein LOC117820336 n=1 Tax=Notolabrus celidotus TaxID=1203425 RepID=UPI0014901933|nr:uncharacterized protein LOC117820336 [Notolabrus celidotus]
MAVLILLLTWLSPVLPAMNKLPQPVNLDLTSDHFIYLLRWERGAGTPPGASYRVSLCTDRGTSWRPVLGCQSVVDPLLCNLTEALSNPLESYLTKVTAYLGTQSSNGTYKRLTPSSGLGPPLLSVAPCERNLCVELQPPLQRLRPVYELLKYGLRVSSGENTVLDSVSLDGYVLSHVAPGRQYCASVCVADTLHDIHSNYSQPVCVVTPSTFITDALVSSLLSVLVLIGVAVGVFLFSAGFICLRRRPLPSVLTSLIHIEEVLVLAAPCPSSFSPLYNDKSTAPPAGEKRSGTSSTESDDEEEESTPESTGGGGGLYLLKKGTNLPSSSTSSSSSSLAPSSPLSPFSNLPSHSFTPPPPSPSPPPPQTLMSAEPAPPAGHEHTLNTHSADQTAHTHTIPEPPAGGGEEVRDGLNVNLLTLTFDREDQEEEEEEEEEPEISSIITPSLLPQRVAVETVSCPEEEDEEDDDDDEEEDDEEEEESSGYICTHTLLHLYVCVRVESCSFDLQNGSWRRMELRILLLLHLQLVGVCLPLPPPSNVSISSFNMQHTLSFLPGPQSPAHTRYVVQTLSLSKRKPWKSVAACSELTAGQTCNLTQVFKNPFDSYMARVQAYTTSQTSNWTGSANFQPLTHTVLGPPGLSVSGCGNCLNLQLTLPATGGQQQQKQLRDLYSNLDFQVKRTRDGAQFVLSVAFTEQVVVSYLQTGVEYCVSVRVSARLSSTSLYSQPQCAYTSPPPSVHTPVLATFGLMGALCAVCLVFICLVIYRGGRSFKRCRLLSPLDVERSCPDLYATTSLTQLHEDDSAD